MCLGKAEEVWLTKNYPVTFFPFIQAMFAGWNEPGDFGEKLRSADDETKEMAGTASFCVLFNLVQTAAEDWGLAGCSQSHISHPNTDWWMGMGNGPLADREERT
jgi:hypothetical protein